MSLNLYDVLDVDETASTADIRAAWKTAVADLDPTDRRFRAYNDAAAVLLDGERRASYDAELAAVRAEEPAEEPDEEVDEKPDDEADEIDEAVVVEPAPPLPVAPEADTVGDVEGEVDTDTEGEVDTDAAAAEVQAELAADAADADAADADVTDANVTDANATAADAADADATEPDSAERDAAAAAASRGPSAGPPRWAMWVAAVAAVLGVALAVGIRVLPGVAEGESPADVAERADQLRDAGNSAQIAATDTIVPLLGYDYRTMEQNLTQIQSGMTPSMADRQAQSWSALTKEAKSQQVVVTAEAPYVALTRMSDDGERATVVAFIDQFVKKKDAEPFTLQMWATLTLVRDGDQWLLDDICTEGDCA